MKPRKIYILLITLSLFLATCWSTPIRKCDRNKNSLRDCDKEDLIYSDESEDEDDYFHSDDDDDQEDSAINEVLSGYFPTAQELLELTEEEDDDDDDDGISLDEVSSITEDNDVTQQILLIEQILEANQDSVEELSEVLTEELTDYVMPLMSEGEIEGLIQQQQEQEGEVVEQSEGEAESEVVEHSEGGIEPEVVEHLEGAKPEVEEPNFDFDDYVQEFEGFAGGEEGHPQSEVVESGEEVVKPEGLNLPEVQPLQEPPLELDGLQPEVESQPSENVDNTEVEMSSSDPPQEVIQSPQLPPEIVSVDPSFQDINDSEPPLLHSTSFDPPQDFSDSVESDVVPISEIVEEAAPPENLNEFLSPTDSQQPPLPEVQDELQSETIETAQPPQEASPLEDQTESAPDSHEFDTPEQLLQSAPPQVFDEVESFPAVADESESPQESQDFHPEPPQDALESEPTQDALESEPPQDALESEPPQDALESEPPQDVLLSQPPPDVIESQSAQDVLQPSIPEFIPPQEHHIIDSSPEPHHPVIIDEVVEETHTPQEEFEPLLSDVLEPEIIPPIADEETQTIDPQQVESNGWTPSPSSETLFSGATLTDSSTIPPLPIQTDAEIQTIDPQQVESSNGWTPPPPSGWTSESQPFVGESSAFGSTIDIQNLAGQATSGHDITLTATAAHGEPAVISVSTDSNPDQMVNMTLGEAHLGTATMPASGAVVASSVVIIQTGSTPSEQNLSTTGSGTVSTDSDATSGVSAVSLGHSNWASMSNGVNSVHGSGWGATSNGTTIQGGTSQTVDELEAAMILTNAVIVTATGNNSSPVIFDSGNNFNTSQAIILGSTDPQLILNGDPIFEGTGQAMTSQGHSSLITTVHTSGIDSLEYSSSPLSSNGFSVNGGILSGFGSISNGTNLLGGGGGWTAPEVILPSLGSGVGLQGGSSPASLMGGGKKPVVPII